MRKGRRQTNLPEKRLPRRLSRFEELCLGDPTDVAVHLFSLVGGKESKESDGGEPVAFDEGPEEEEAENGGEGRGGESTCQYSFCFSSPG